MIYSPKRAPRVSNRTTAGWFQVAISPELAEVSHRLDSIPLSFYFSRACRVGVLTHAVAVGKALKFLVI
jgi:hypothetical protein